MTSFYHTPIRTTLSEANKPSTLLPGSRGMQGAYENTQSSFTSSEGILTEPSDSESNCQVPVKKKVAVKHNPNFRIYVQQLNFLVHAHKADF